MLTGWTITANKVNGVSVEVPYYDGGRYLYELSNVNTDADLTVEFTAVHSTKGEVTITFTFTAYSV